MAVCKGDLIKRLWIASVVTIAVAASAAGQGMEGSGLRFRVFRSGEGNWDGVRVAVGDDSSQPVIFRKNRRSAPIDYRGTQPLTFFRQSLLPITESVPISMQPSASTFLGRVSVNPEWREVLIFFVALPNQDRFLIYPVEDDLATFPAGSLRVINFSGVNLVGKIGSQKAHFPQGASTAYANHASDDEGISVSFVSQTAEGPQAVFSKRIWYAPHQRLMLLFEPPRHHGSSRLVVKRIVQSVRRVPLLSEAPNEN